VGILSKKSSFIKQGLSGELLTGFGTALFTAGLFTLSFSYTLLESHLQTQVRQQARSIVQSLEFSTESTLEAERLWMLRRVVQNYVTLPAVREIAIVAPDGETITRSGAFKNDRPYALVRPQLAAAMEDSARSGEERFLELELDGKPVLVEILPFHNTLFGTSGRRGLAIAILDLRQLQAATLQMFLTLTGAIAIGIVAILILMWVSIHRVVLKPLTLVNQAVAESDRTGVFTMPANLPRNEIKFLARNFERVVKQLEAYDQLHKEIEQRKQVEAALRQSEARERAKSHELGKLVRELKQTQAQLVQTEKMSSLGRMVGGVAHEINNPVSFIFGNLTFAQEYFEQLVDLIELYQQSYPQPTPQIARRLDEIELEFLIDDTQKLFASMKVGAERIRDIVLSLRNFSRFDEAELKSVKIEEGLRNTLLILQPRFQGGSPVEIVTVEEFGDLPLVECYASQINQVFLNLLSNAIDALESDERYRQGRELPVPATIWIRTEALNKKTIAVRIRDNGPGMPPEVREKAFDPFFTTKEIGKGTGLGLSISYQIIVEQHKGGLECISKPGEGTEFVIEIPTQIPRS